MKQEKIGKFIKEKRLKKNLTQSEFANILGAVSYTHLRAHETVLQKELYQIGKMVKIYQTYLYIMIYVKF